LEGLGLVASCSMDRTVKLWDLSSRRLKNTLVGHPQGVCNMSYHSDLRLLVTAGFGFPLLVSNPYVSRPISRLSGHAAPNAGVSVIAGSHLLVSGDVAGVFKLWDLRNFGCIQTFVVGAAGSVGRGLGLCSPYRKLVCGGRFISCFQQLRDVDADVADATPVLSIGYNTSDLTFWTASATTLKVWDAESGVSLREYANAPHSLSVACLDKHGRRFIFGDGSGRMRALNYLNGGMQGEFAYAGAAGSGGGALIHEPEHQLLVSATAAGRICVHATAPQERGRLVRRLVRAASRELSALALSAHLGLVASGNADGRVDFWDFQSLRHEGVCQGAHPAGVVCLQFLDPLPLLLTADTEGNVALFATRPSAQALVVCYRWINWSAAAAMAAATAATVTAARRSVSGSRKITNRFCCPPLLCSLTFAVYLGAESGHVTEWNLMPLLDSLSK
ncbi:unnamed protein product, partial [Phaeothamnion confervicola]